MGQRGKQPQDLTGMRVGKLVILSESPQRGRDNHVYWRCRCDCGKEPCVRSTRLKSGTVKSCGACAFDTLIRHNPQAKPVPLRSGEANFNMYFGGYRYGAIKRGHSFELTREEFRGLTSQPCHYCGCPPHTIYRKSDSNGGYVGNGIDRVDNEQGYTLENCVPCCTNCNRAKGKQSYLEFANWLDKAARYRLNLGLDKADKVQ